MQIIINTRVDNDGDNGFVYSCIYDNLHVVKFFKNILEADEFQTNAQNGFYSACQYGNLNVVEYLVKNGVKIDQIHDSGFGGFHYACNEGYLPVVKYLIVKGCNVHVIDLDGSTGIENACQKNHLTVIQCLMNYVAFEGINHWNFHLTAGLRILLENFSENVAVFTKPSILLLLETGAQLQENESLPFEIKNAVKNRMVEITYTKTKLFEKFPTKYVIQLLNENSNG
jgi:ankyrin repeat protein